MPANAAPIESGPYRIPRYILARLSVEQYVRLFWWFIICVPLFGIVALVTARGLLQVIGMFAVLWPATIPARSVLASWKAGRFFSHEVRVTLENDILYFHGSNGRGMKLACMSVRRVVRRHGYILLTLKIADLVAIPESAFEDGGNLFFAALSDCSERRLAAAG